MHNKRTTCRLCGSTDVSAVIPLHPILIGEHYTNVRPDQVGSRFPIDIYQCNNCSAVQTMDEIDNNFLWKDYTYFSSQNKSVKKHFKGFSQRIDSYFKTKGKVLDIGSNDGTLLTYFRDLGWQVQGIDPAETVVKEANRKEIPTIHGFFDDKTAMQLDIAEKYDLITAFNVFAHSSDMQGMLANVRKLLKDSGLFCFEVQYLGDISEQHILGTVFHEHMVHYSLHSASKFLESEGLEVFDFERNNNQNGSIIFFCKKKNNMTREVQINNIKSLKEYEESIHINTKEWASKFMIRLINDRTTVSKALKDKQIAKDELAAYGAARSGPTLAIQYCLDDFIGDIYDDHPSKCGYYSPFNGKIVKKSSLITEEMPKMIVILAYLYYKQIINDLDDYIQRGGVVLLLWPEVRVISNK